MASRVTGPVSKDNGEPVAPRDVTFTVQDEVALVGDLSSHREDLALFRVRFLEGTG